MLRDEERVAVLRQCIDDRMAKEAEEQQAVDDLIRVLTAPPPGWGRRIPAIRRRR